MPRAEVGTPKWLSNKMKSKGLQRLRWYCQMCEKQCRDENGFKCHCMSEGHRRQMQVFSQRPGRYMGDFSRQFEACFMKLMRTRYCRARVLANTVYCDLIADKQHVHMNSTVWSTLSEFVLYLKRSGKCKVEHSDEGWYIEYIDGEKVAREEREAAKRKAEISCEQTRERRLNKIIAEAWKAVSDKPTEDTKILPFKNDEDTECIQFTIPDKHTKPKNVPPEAINVLDVKAIELPVESSKSPDKVIVADSNKRNVLNDLVTENEDKKFKKKLYIDNEESQRLFPSTQSEAKFKKKCKNEQTERKFSSQYMEQEEDDDTPWLYPNIIVRCLNTEVENGKYFQEKAKVISIQDKFLGKIEMLQSHDILLIDQEYLEPVIPTKDSVMVIKGKFKGETAVIESIDLENKTATLLLSGRSLKKASVLPFTTICKYQPP